MHEFLNWQISRINDITRLGNERDSRILSGIGAKVIFIVYAPGIYTPAGGGCVALHKLAHNISSLGEECYIMADSKNPAYKGTLINETDAKGIAALDNAIVIYPEVICGNPLNAKHVMRWVLYHVRQHGEFGIWGENDLIYKYAPFFELRLGGNVQGELRAMELNLDIWQNQNLPRWGSCHLYKKAGASKPDIHPENSFCLDEYPIKGGFEFLFNMFNRCEYFYSYDSATWLSIMAALCGCKSIVVPDTGVTALQWYNGFPYFKYGIAYGESQLQHADCTAPLIRANLNGLDMDTINQTRAFINKAKEICK